jgi:hypothetical protein
MLFLNMVCLTVAPADSIEGLGESKLISPSLRRRKFHERKIPISRRSSSMSIGDPTDTYRAVRPFKSVDHAYDREKKSIVVTDLDNAEVEMTKASHSTPNLSELAWAKDAISVDQQELRKSRDFSSTSSLNSKVRQQDVTENGKLDVESNDGVIVEDIDCEFKDDGPVAEANQNSVGKECMCDHDHSHIMTEAPPPLDFQQTSGTDQRVSKKIDKLDSFASSEGDKNPSPVPTKAPLKSTSAAQVRYISCLKNNL